MTAWCMFKGLYFSETKSSSATRARSSPANLFVALNPTWQISGGADAIDLP